MMGNLLNSENANVFFFTFIWHQSETPVVQSIKLHQLEGVKDAMQTRRQAFMASLILEQPDPRVDQQWINMAPITMQRIPSDTGHHILKVLFQRVAKLWIFFWITNPNRQVQVYGVGGFGDSFSIFVWWDNFHFAFMTPYCIAFVPYSGNVQLFSSAFLNDLKSQNTYSNVVCIEDALMV